MIKRLTHWIRSIGKPRCVVHPKTVLTQIPGEGWMYCHLCAPHMLDRASPQHQEALREMVRINRPKNAPVPLARIKDPE